MSTVCCKSQTIFDGANPESPRQQVSILSLGNVEAVRIGATRLKKQNKVNAKTSTLGTVAVKAGKSFRFGKSTARAAAFA